MSKYYCQIKKPLLLKGWNIQDKDLEQGQKLFAEEGSDDPRDRRGEACGWGDPPGGRCGGHGQPGDDLKDAPDTKEGEGAIEADRVEHKFRVLCFLGFKSRNQNC